MGWQKLPSESLTITVKSTGYIEWNDETQRQLDNPEGVELFYDSGTGKLGFRRVSLRGVQCVVVTHIEEDSVWRIDADYELDEAGIKPEVDVEGSLTGPTTGGEGEGEAGIYWIDLGS